MSVLENRIKRLEDTLVNSVESFGDGDASWARCVSQINNLTLEFQVDRQTGAPRHTPFEKECITGLLCELNSLHEIEEQVPAELAREVERRWVKHPDACLFAWRAVLTARGRAGKPVPQPVPWL